MAERIGAGIWSVQGETITLPVTVTDARITAAVFSTAPAEARDLLAGTPLRPLVLGGRAFSLLMCIHYGDWALKTYDEVGVGVFALGPGRRPGLYLVDLPVTGAFTREAGEDLWALPKWIMEADLRFDSARTSVLVRDGDAEVMRAAFRHRLPLPLPVRSSMPTWSYLPHGAQAGRLLRGRVPMSLAGIRVGRGVAPVRLPPAGTHPMASRMAALGMLGRPLLTLHADCLTGSFGEFDQVA
ncbi:MAG TPA: acetoacetate decarboxylase family protein [Actinoplanes sp.]